MTDLAAQLRALTESAADPIDLEEVTTRAPGGRATPPPGEGADHPHRGRMALAAAMVAFIAGLAGLSWYVAARSGSPTPTAAAGTGSLHALPPAVVSDLTVVFPDTPPFEDRGGFLYGDPVLGPVQLYTGSSASTGFTDARTDVDRAREIGADAVTAEVAGFGTVAVVCLPPPGSTGPDGSVVAFQGSALIRWYGDGLSTTLVQDESGNGSCRASERAGALEQAMKSVRLVSREEWERFISENRGGLPGSSADASTPAAKPGPAGWCDAVEALRGSGTIDPVTGHLRADALPYLRRMLSEAPTEVAPPIQTLIDWLEEGAPTPLPSEVSAAESASTVDWVNRCPAD